jgi:hypothetical protein
MMIDFVEWLGYAASLIVLVSLLMSSVKRLRWINLAGSLAFAVYGFLVGALPVGFMNLGIVVINIYFLFQMYTKKDYFTLLPTSDMSYFNHFMGSYKSDIKQYMSVDENLDDAHHVRLFILRNTVPAGVVVAKTKDLETLEILIDYVTPTYRDFKMGQFLYRDQKLYFTNLGYKRLISKPGTEKHESYLKRMGFVLESINQESFYVKTL